VARRTIISARLRGLETDHTDCRFAAPSFSTGVLEHTIDTIDESEPIGWSMEFHCTVCKQKYFSYNIDFHESIREVLIENGIIPASNKVGPNY